MDRIENQIKSITGAIKSNAFVALLATLCVCNAVFLINESGRFLNSLYPDSSTWGIMAAALIEVTALCLICYRPGNLIAWITRGLLIIGIFSAIVGGSAFYAVNPILDGSRLSGLDALKIDALRAEIAGLEQDAIRLENQPVNLAIVSRKRLAANDRLQSAISEAETRINSTGNQIDRSGRIGIAVLIRILLQASNWLLIGWIASIVRSRKVAPMPVHKHEVERVEKSFQDFVNPVQVSEKAMKLLSWIKPRGEVKRQELLTSRQLENAAEYDSKLQELIQAGAVIGKNGTGRKADIVYRIGEVE